MSLMKCPKCGDVFSMGKFAVCPACREKENEVIDLLKHHVDANPKTDIDELEKISGLPRDQILRHIREGRLIIDSSVVVLQCEECGSEILSGRFCRPCREKLSSLLSSSLDPLKLKKR